MSHLQLNQLSCYFVPSTPLSTPALTQKTTQRKFLAFWQRGSVPTQIKKEELKKSGSVGPPGPGRSHITTKLKELKEMEPRPPDHQTPPCPLFCQCSGFSADIRTHSLGASGSLQPAGQGSSSTLARVGRHRSVQRGRSRCRGRPPPPPREASSLLVSRAISGCGGGGER